MQEMQKTRLDPWVRKIPWSEKWQPTPVFLLGKVCGQRSLAGYNSHSNKELDKTGHWALALTGLMKNC